MTKVKLNPELSIYDKIESDGISELMTYIESEKTSSFDSRFLECLHIRNDNFLIKGKYVTTRKRIINWLRGEP